MTDPAVSSPPPSAGPGAEERAEAGTSRDLFLAGRIAVLQPARGRHRSGHDAILLAGCLAGDAAGEAVDLGAGVGVAGLALAARAPGLRVTLAERDPVALALARKSLELPENRALRDRVRVIGVDVTAPASARHAAGLGRESADQVILNPPFHAAGTVRAATPGRAAAHVLEAGGLDRWIRTAGDILRPRGRLALIFPAAGLKTVLDAFEGRFGAVRIRPVLARPGGEAIRILAGGCKGSRAPLTLLAPRVLHGASGSEPSPEAAAVLAGTADGALL